MPIKETIKHYLVNNASGLGHRLLFGRFAPHDAAQKGRLILSHLKLARDPEVLNLLLSTQRLSMTLEPELVPHPPGKRILAIAPHQDDDIVGAGGALLKAMAAGAEAGAVYITDGGGSKSNKDRLEYQEKRRQEAAAVWERMGGASPRFLDLPGKEIPVNTQSAKALADAVNAFSPDLLLVPSFWDQPKDHADTSRLLLLAHRENLLPKVPVWIYQVYAAFCPNLAVDITGQGAEKDGLMRLFESQNRLFDWAAYTKSLASANSLLVRRKLTRRDNPLVELFLALDYGQYFDTLQFFFQKIDQPPDEVAGKVARLEKVMGKIDRAPAMARGMAGKISGPIARKMNPGRWHSDVPPDFLVVGLQKCATSWVVHLLDAHPEISCLVVPSDANPVKEGHFFDGLGSLDIDRRFFDIRMLKAHDGFFRDIGEKADDLPREELIRRLKGRYNAFLQNHKAPGTTLVGDKTTEYVFHLGLIESLYPGIRKICILRRPADRIVSFHHHQVRKGRLAPVAVGDAEVEAYLDRVEREYRAMLEFEGSLRLLTFESLKADNSAGLAGMLDYLGLAHDETALGGMVERASFSRLTGRMSGQADPKSHFRKGVVGDGQRELTPDQLETVRSRLADLTERLAAKYGLDLSDHLA